MKTSLRIMVLAIALALCVMFSATAQWVQINGPEGRGLKSYAVIGSNIFVSPWDCGVYLSTNDGLSWTNVESGLTSRCIQCFGLHGNNLFAGATYGPMIFLTTNSGANWTSVGSGLSGYSVTAFAAIGSDLFAAMEEAGVFRSTDNGASWTQGGLGNNYYFNALAVSGTKLYAASGSSVFLSTDYGASWTDISPVTHWGLIIYSLAVQGGNLFAGTERDGIMRTTDDGGSWIEVNTGLPFTQVEALAVSGTTLFAGTFKGVFLSSNNGQSWKAVNTGMTSNYVHALTISGTDLYALSSREEMIDTTLWKRSIPEMLQSVSGVPTEPPTIFKLSQNYPNPFNPSTTIEFSVPQAGLVSLKVINVFGKVVATLVNEELQPGSYGTVWDASGFGSGVYFYRLQAGRFLETKKLTVR